MDNKIVTFAKHDIFFNYFFDTHSRILNNLSELEFSNLFNGFSILINFHSGYSYWLNDELKDISFINIKRNELETDKDYIYIRKNTNNGDNINNLNIKNLILYNTVIFNSIREQLEIFGELIENLAKDDILPNLTSKGTEYEKNVMYASYQKFYEHLYEFHFKIGNMFSEFNLLKFLKTIKYVMGFFYGYIFYLNQTTIRDINKKINIAWSLYNNEKTIKILLDLLNNKSLLDSEIKLLRETQQDLFMLLTDIFRSINEDMPKKNLMPKKKERVTIDKTLI